MFWGEFNFLDISSYGLALVARFLHITVFFTLVLLTLIS